MLLNVQNVCRMLMSHWRINLHLLFLTKPAIRFTEFNEIIVNASRLASVEINELFEPFWDLTQFLFGGFVSFNLKAFSIVARLLFFLFCHVSIFI